MTGLEVGSDCDYPCKTCLSTDPTHCLSCFSASAGAAISADSSWPSMPFLQENTCLETCSDGLYGTEVTEVLAGVAVGIDEWVCEPCDYTCLKCEERADKCTQCGKGDYLFLVEIPQLDRHECVTDCPTGFVNKPSENMCAPCKEGCRSCDYETTNCTSCVRDGPTPFFFKYDCVDDCEKGISIMAGRTCQECDPTCRTCEDTPDTCRSCEDYMRFDTFNSKCLEACLPDVQIYMPPIPGSDVPG